MLHRPVSRRAVVVGALVFAPQVRAEALFTFGDGVVVRVPHGFSAELDGDALHVTQTAAVRTPLNMTLRIDPSFSLHPRWVANRSGDIRFTVRNMGGEGSGGPVHELRARRQLPDGTNLALIAHRQGEMAPDFEMALDLLRSARRLPE